MPSAAAPARWCGYSQGCLPSGPRIFPRWLHRLAAQKEMYFTFYTLNYALQDRETTIVSRQPVPSWARPYPLMRWSPPPDGSGKPAGVWKLFDASTPLTVENHMRTPVLHELSPEQKKLSIHRLWPHPAMVRELARGWTPERAEELRLRDLAEAAERKKGAPAAASADKNMRHYLYFPKKPAARKAEERHRGSGFAVEIRKGADGKNWLALATRTPPQTGEEMDQVRNEMEALAAELNGEYDGWELPVE
jgi:hypothetical protein